MANLGSAWTETIPSDTSIVGYEPAHLRSVWTSLSVGLATSLDWPGAGGGSQASIGGLKRGASRAFYAEESASSQSNAVRALGRALLASDSSRLYVYESSRTQLIGTPYLIEHVTEPRASTWVVQRGNQVVSSAGTPVSQNVSFSTPYVVVPTVQQIFHIFDSAGSFLRGISDITAGGFTSVFSFFGPGSQSTFTIQWTSLGTIAGNI